MDCSQDLLELDSEIGRINLMRDSGPFLPVLPSPEIFEEPVQDGLNTTPVTPLHSPHAFLKKERWLFSLPLVVPTLSTHPKVTSPSNTSDNTESRQNPTPHIMVREKKPKAHRKRAAHPTSLPLMLEEHPPRKRIRSNMVTAHLNCSVQDTLKTPTFTGNDHFGKTSAHPILLVRLVTLPVGPGPTIWHPPSLLQIISHLTPNLVRQLTTSQMPYVSPPPCHIPRK